MKEETMGSSEPVYERLGAKVLSLPDVIAQSVGFMGPVFASAFVIPLGLGERIGTAAGWLYYGGVVVLTSVLLLLMGGYLQSTIAAEFSVNPLPSWAWTLLLIALIAVILYFGVRLSTRSQLTLALVSIIVVTIFFVTVIVKLGSANSVKPFNPSSAADGWSGIFFGVLYGVLIFVGFETAANLAEETP